MGKAEYISCPMCGMNRKLHKSGKYHQSKIGEPEIIKEPSTSSFGNFDFKNNKFVLIRDMIGGRFPGGKGRGFPLIPEECLTIKQASSISEYQDLLQQIDDFCKNWLKFRKLKT